jgi:hypothetical protein
MISRQYAAWLAMQVIYDDAAVYSGYLKVYPPT